MNYEPIMNLISSSGVVILRSPKASVMTFATFVERNPGKVGPTMISLNPNDSSASNTATAFCSYQARSWDSPPVNWFEDKGDDYLDLHLIPKDRTLWRLDNYERFIEERKKLILEKFNYLITKQV